MKTLNEKFVISTSVYLEAMKEMQRRKTFTESEIDDIFNDCWCFVLFGSTTKRAGATTASWLCICRWRSSSRSGTTAVTSAVKYIYCTCHWGKRDTNEDCQASEGEL